MEGNFLDALVMPASMDERICALVLLLRVKHKPWCAKRRWFLRTEEMPEPTSRHKSKSSVE
jgi:hypothetical protein